MARLLTLRSATRAVLLLALVVPELLRTDVLVQEIPGVNSYNTHRAFFGDRKIEQTLPWPRTDIASVGVWLGRYRRESEPRGDVVLRVRLSDHPEATLREVRVPLAGVVFGEITFFRFQPISVSSAADVTLELSAPGAVSESALAARIDPKPGNKAMAAFRRSGNREPVQLAVRLSRRAGYWSKLFHTLSFDHALRRLALGSLLLGGVLVALSVLLGPGGSHITRREIVVMALLLVGFFHVRMSLLQEVTGVPRGDPYNNAFIAQRLLTGGNPYENEKRLPGYPLVMVLGTAAEGDPLRAGQVVNQLLLVCAAGAVYAVGRRVGLSPRGALFAALAFVFSREVFFVSFHPLSYTLLALQIPLVILTVPWAHGHIGRSLVLGSLLGWTAQTRHEGIVLAGIVLGALFVRAALRRRFWAPWAVCTVATLLFLAPLPLHNLRAYGNPFYTAYYDLPATNPRHSLNELRQNAGLTWSAVSSAWWPYWRQEIRFPLDARFTGTAALLLLTGAISVPLQRRLTAEARLHVFRLLGAAGVIATLLFLQRAASDQTVAFSSIVRAGVVGAVVGWALLAQKDRRSWPVLGLGLLLLLLPFWAHPAGKNFVPFWWFPALGIGALLEALVPTWRKGDRSPAVLWSGGVSVLLLAYACLPIVALARGLPGMIERFNTQQVEDTLVRHAAQAAQRLPVTGAIALQHLYLPVLAYLDGGRFVERLPGNQTPLSEWLAQQNVCLLLWRSSDTVFAGLTDSPDSYQILFEEQGIGSDGGMRTVRLYGVRPGGCQRTLSPKRLFL